MFLQCLKGKVIDRAVRGLESALRIFSRNLQSLKHYNNYIFLGEAEGLGLKVTKVGGLGRGDYLGEWYRRNNLFRAVYGHTAFR